jgi:hypothetical protein
VGGVYVSDEIPIELPITPTGAPTPQPKQVAEPQQPRGLLEEAKTLYNEIEKHFTNTGEENPKVAATKFMQSAGGKASMRDWGSEELSKARSAFDARRAMEEGTRLSAGVHGRELAEPAPLEDPEPAQAQPAADTGPKADPEAIVKFIRTLKSLLAQRGIVAGVADASVARFLLDVAGVSSATDLSAAQLERLVKAPDTAEGLAVVAMEVQAENRKGGKA